MSSNKPTFRISFNNRIGIAPQRRVAMGRRNALKTPKKSQTSCLYLWVRIYYLLMDRKTTGIKTASSTPGLKSETTYVPFFSHHLLAYHRGVTLVHHGFSSDRSNQRVKLKVTMFNLAAGTKLPRDLFTKLSLLQNGILSLLRDGHLFDADLDSRSQSHLISSELSFLRCLDAAFDSDANGYEVLCRTRDTYATLNARSQQIQHAFKDIIAHPVSEGYVRLLLDALTNLGEVACIYSSRVQRLDALLVRWCNGDSEQVQRALREVRSCRRGKLHCYTERLLTYLVRGSLVSVKLRALYQVEEVCKLLAASLRKSGYPMRSSTRCLSFSRQLTMFSFWIHYSSPMLREESGSDFISITWSTGTGQSYLSVPLL